MTESTFQKVGKSEKRMFGPPCILVCGYGAEEQDRILALFEKCGLSPHPVVFSAKEDEGATLGELVRMDDGQGRGVSSGLARAVILSGLTEKELHRLISTYRAEGFPAQLWATLTPISEGWTLGKLLAELSAEAEAFRKARQEKDSEVL